MHCLDSFHRVFAVGLTAGTEPPITRFPTQAMRTSHGRHRSCTLSCDFISINSLSPTRSLAAAAAAAAAAAVGVIRIVVGGDGDGASTVSCACGRINIQVPVRRRSSCCCYCCHAVHRHPCPTAACRVRISDGLDGMTSLQRGRPGDRTAQPRRNCGDGDVGHATDRAVRMYSLGNDALCRRRRLSGKWSDRSAFASTRAAAAATHFSQRHCNLAASSCFIRAVGSVSSSGSSSSRLDTPAVEETSGFD
jgi:hypothetical protein